MNLHCIVLTVSQRRLMTTPSLSLYYWRPHVNACCKLYAHALACSMRGGELFDRLIQRGAYSEAEARKPFHEVALALQYLHQ